MLLCALRVPWIESRRTRQPRSALRDREPWSEVQSVRAGTIHAFAPWTRDPRCATLGLGLGGPGRRLQVIRHVAAMAGVAGTPTFSPAGAPPEGPGTRNPGMLVWGHWGRATPLSGVGEEHARREAPEAGAAAADAEAPSATDSLQAAAARVAGDASCDGSGGGGSSVSIYEIRDRRSKMLVLACSATISLLVPFTDTIILPALVDIGADLAASADDIAGLVSACV